MIYTCKLTATSIGVQVNTGWIPVTGNPFAYRFYAQWDSLVSATLDSWTVSGRLHPDANPLVIGTNSTDLVVAIVPVPQINVGLTCFSGLGTKTSWVKI